MHLREFIIPQNLFEWINALRVFSFASLPDLLYHCTFYVWFCVLVVCPLCTLGSYLFDYPALYADKFVFIIVLLKRSISYHPAANIFCTLWLKFPFLLASPCCAGIFYFSGNAFHNICLVLFICIWHFICLRLWHSIC